MCMTKKAFSYFKKSRRLYIKLKTEITYAAIFLRTGKISVRFIIFSEAQASIKQQNAPRNTLVILRSIEYIIASSAWKSLFILSQHLSVVERLL